MQNKPRLIMPALGSDRVYVVDVKTDPRKPKLDKVMLDQHCIALHCIAGDNSWAETTIDNPGPKLRYIHSRS